MVSLWAWAEKAIATIKCEGGLVKQVRVNLAREQNQCQRINKPRLLGHVSIIDYVREQHHKRVSDKPDYISTSHHQAMLVATLTAPMSTYGRDETNARQRS